MILEVTNLHKSYGKLLVIDNLSFSIPHPQWVMLIGQSGCGKSTLLNILGFLDKPQKGKIKYLFTNHKKGTSFRQKHLGFIFQNYNLISELTTFENIILPALFTSKSKRNIYQNAKRLLKLVGLENRTKAYPNTLSGGEQQRVAIARALINDPSIILADEPTGNLDLQNAKNIIDIFVKLKEQGKTIIMVTHSTKFTKYADQIIDLSNKNQ